MPGIQNHRYVLEPISKLVSHSLQYFTVQYHTLVSVCHLCNKAFVKERDKLLVTRTAVFELISALKFKTVIPDSNFLVLTNLVLQDAGGAVIEDIQGLSYQVNFLLKLPSPRCSSFNHDCNDIAVFGLVQESKLSRVNQN